MGTLRIGFLASHGGSAARAVAGAIAAGRLDAGIRIVISNNSGSPALAWAAAAGIATAHISTATVRRAGRPGAGVEAGGLAGASGVAADPRGEPPAGPGAAGQAWLSAVDAATRDRLREHGVEWIVLSGYLRPVGPLTLDAFRGRVLNVHPALLPAFGGRGMYGDRVHAAVLASGATESGATVHVVDEAYDHGPVLGQRRVPVLPGDDVGRLRARVMAAEAGLLVDTLARLASGRREARP